MSESASLILSTKSTTNPAIFGPAIGGITTKNSFVFNNIDLKNVLGEMWDKYDQFALKVVQINTQGTITAASSPNSTVCYNMAGLDWSNLIYETTGSNIINQWVGLNFFSSLNAYFVTPSNTGQSFNFKKGNRNVNLQFALNIPDATGVDSFGGFPNQPSTANVYNDVAFHFVIEPVIAGKQNECAYYGFNSNLALTGLNRVVSSDRKEFSYASFNMRKLCEQFWDKHDNFEIQMAQYALRGTGTLAGDARISPVQLSGLNFINNQTKETNDTNKIGLSTENTIIGTVILNTATTTHNSEMQYTPAPVQFLKTSDLVPLTLTFRNAENTAVSAASYTSVHPQFQIGFFIKPIYEVNKGTLNISPWGLTTTETNLGVRDTNYTTFTLKNINLKQVCKSFWDKYDRFNIFLTSLTSFSNAGNATNAAVIIQMSGLDFISQTSYITSAGQTQTATLGSFFLSGTASTDPRAQAIQSSGTTTFIKSREVVDITLTALTLGGSAFSSQAPLGCNFTFTIVGVKSKD
jgi:hypothetical protein